MLGCLAGHGIAGLLAFCCRALLRVDVMTCRCCNRRAHGVSSVVVVVVVSVVMERLFPHHLAALSLLSGLFAVRTHALWSVALKEVKPEHREKPVFVRANISCQRASAPPSTGISTGLSSSACSISSLQVGSSAGAAEASIYFAERCPLSTSCARGDR